MTRALLVLLTVCAGSPPPALELGPATDRDPETWVEPPASEGHAGQPVSLTLAGGRDEARALALRFVAAVRDADEATLRELLDDPLARAQPRPSTPHLPREQVLELMLRSPRRGDLGPEVPLEELVAIDQLAVTPLAEVARTVPRGLVETDLFVSVPLSPRGRAVLRFLVPGWHLRGALLLRSTPNGWRVMGL